MKCRLRLYRDIMRKIKEQCKNDFVMDSGLPLIYYCVRKKGHKGCHRGLWTKMARSGKVLKTKTLWWD